MLYAAEKNIKREKCQFDVSTTAHCHVLSHAAMCYHIIMPIYNTLTCLSILNCCRYANYQCTRLTLASIELAIVNYLYLKCTVYVFSEISRQRLRSHEPGGQVTVLPILERSDLIPLRSKGGVTDHHMWASEAIFTARTIHQLIQSSPFVSLRQGGARHLF